MEISALIVDDEPDSRSVLKRLLKSFCPEINVIGEAGNVTKAYELIMEHKPKVVFLDIQMPGGNGFSLLKKFEEVPFDVVFVTSYDKYALEAIRLSALYYLMKPVEVDDLKEAVERVKRNAIKNGNQRDKLVNLLFNLDGAGLERRMAIHYNDRVKLLQLADITHFEGERNYTTIHTVDKEKYKSAKNLGSFEETLEGYPQFFRVSKACMINLNYVTNYSKGEPCVLTVANEFSYEISRRKKQEFLDRLKK